MLYFFLHKPLKYPGNFKHVGIPGSSIANGGLKFWVFSFLLFLQGICELRDQKLCVVTAETSQPSFAPPEPCQLPFPPRDLVPLLLCFAVLPTAPSRFEVT